MGRVRGSRPGLSAGGLDSHPVPLAARAPSPGLPVTLTPWPPPRTPRL